MAAQTVIMLPKRTICKETEKRKPTFQIVECMDCGL